MSVAEKLRSEGEAKGRLKVDWKDKIEFVLKNLSKEIR